jgi:hypothetical protein
MAIELIPLEETAETTPEVPATPADVVPSELPAEPKKGKGRPPGSKNKSKPVPEVASEPVLEPVVIEPAPESVPEAVAKVTKKRQAPPPPTPPPMIAVIPERPRPEDMLRQLQQDARQRLTDSYNIRREGWTAELNSKYK